MAKLLFILASPRDRSNSTKVGQKFVEVYRKAHPKDVVETLDLWDTDLPPFDENIVAAKYKTLHGLPHTPEEAQAWNHVKEMYRHFSAADKFVFTAPMWNFHIPYQLKHYIDALTQPGLAITLTQEGTFVGQVTGKPACLIYASGGMYGPGTGADALGVQKPYMKTWLEFIGFKDIREIIADGTLLSESKAAEERAIETAKALAVNF